MNIFTAFLKKKGKKFYIFSPKATFSISHVGSMDPMCRGCDSMPVPNRIAVNTKKTNFLRAMIFIAL